MSRGSGQHRSAVRWNGLPSTGARSSPVPHLPLKDSALAPVKLSPCRRSLATSGIACVRELCAKTLRHFSLFPLQRGGFPIRSTNNPRAFLRCAREWEGWSHRHTLRTPAHLLQVVRAERPCALHRVTRDVVARCPGCRRKQPRCLAAIRLPVEQVGAPIRVRPRDSLSLLHVLRQEVRRFLRHYSADRRRNNRL